MKNTSYIEISKAALQSNIRFLQSFIKKNVIISSVVKGDAYGHGISHFVPLAQECGISHFSVFSCNEAVKVLKFSKKKATIVIMGMIENKNLPWAIKNDIEFFVFEEDRLHAAIKAAKKVGKKAKIHIEIETGLNRTGFNKIDLEKLLPFLKNKNLNITGVCTHYAGAESYANFSRIRSQKRIFLSMCKWLSKNGINPVIKHTACSAAAIRYPDTQMDLVRIGILQYGFWPSQETYIQYIARKKDKSSPLKRIISWKSHVMSVKEVKTGDFIGYGSSFLAQKDVKIAVVPVGYAHGYARSLSNHGRVLVNGKRVSVVGIVNMNMLSLNVDDAPETKKGDEVVLIGKQGDLEVSVASFSELSNQLNYELLTRLPDEIPKIIS